MRPIPASPRKRTSSAGCCGPSGGCERRRHEGTTGKRVVLWDGNGLVGKRVETVREPGPNRPRLISANPDYTPITRRISATRRSPCCGGSTSRRQPVGDRRAQAREPSDRPSAPLAAHQSAGRPEPRVIAKPFSVHCQRQSIMKSTSVPDDCGGSSKRRARRTPQPSAAHRIPASNPAGTPSASTLRVGCCA